jgi:hypothetical protein
MTKKQKRAAGEAKQKANREESIRLGLEAQRKDRVRREKAKMQAEQKKRETPKAQVAAVMRAMVPA